MKTFLVNHYDFRKYDVEASKSSFPQTIIRLILKFIIIYIGVMLLAFIYHQHLTSKPFRWGWNSWGWNSDYIRNLWEQVDKYEWWDFFKFLADFSFGNWPDSIALADGIPALELVSTKFPQTIELLLYSSILISICGYFIGFLIAKAKWKRDFRFLDGYELESVSIFQ